MITLLAPGCNLPYISINKDQEVLSKFYRMLEEILKELDRVHACPTVTTAHQREECTYQPCEVVVTETEDIE